MIISIGGKINSGKDTVGKISQIIIDAPHFTDEAVLSFLDRDVLMPKFTIEKFGGALKDVICVLIACTREDLESHSFKDKVLGEEWWVWKSTTTQDILFAYERQNMDVKYWQLVKLTPRKLLQLVGTEAGRNIIHPNVWVNALMAKYKQKLIQTVKTYKEEPIAEKAYGTIKGEYPNWIITDLRFPNELKAVKDRDGLTIRVNRAESTKSIRYVIMDTSDRSKDKVVNIPSDRPVSSSRCIDACEDFPNCKPCGEEFENANHYSETALDNAEFDEVITNEGSLLDLIAKVREILSKNKIIKYVD